MSKITMRLLYTLVMDMCRMCALHNDRLRYLFEDLRHSKVINVSTLDEVVEQILSKIRKDFEYHVMHVRYSTITNLPLSFPIVVIMIEMLYTSYSMIKRVLQRSEE